MATINISGMHVMRGTSLRDGRETPHGYLRIPAGDAGNSISFDIPFRLRPADHHALPMPVQWDKERLAKAIQQSVARMPSALLTEAELTGLSPWQISGSSVVYTEALAEVIA